MATLLYIAIPMFLALIALEMALDRRRGLALYDGRDTAANLAMGLGNVAVSVLWKGLAVSLAFVVYEYRLFDVPADAWWAWLALLVAEDFCYYWFHRVHHECRLGWAAHINHHSSERFNLAVALRQSWTTPMTGLVFWLPLPLLGFHPLMILTQQAISLIYQFWIHTQTIDRLGPLELVLNTPSHHRVHHGTNPQYIDRNYGGILIVWDRLFGTFETERDAVRFGITHRLHTFNPLRIAFHEWADMVRDAWRAPDVRTKLRYLFKHPGWSPRATR